MSKNKFDSHHIDVNTCAEKIGNRFNLILIAGIRAREIKKGHAKKVKENNGPIITALREIEQGLVGSDYIKKV